MNNTGALNAGLGAPLSLVGRLGDVVGGCGPWMAQGHKAFFKSQKLLAGRYSLGLEAWQCQNSKCSIAPSPLNQRSAPTPQTTPFAPTLLLDMLQHPLICKELIAYLSILLLLVQHTEAGPVTLGTSSASVAATMGGSSLSPLVFVLPSIGAAASVLLLAVCCCSRRRPRNSRIVRPSSVTHQRSGHGTRYGLRITPSSRGHGGYKHMPDPENQEILPPYTPRPTEPAIRPDPSSSIRIHSYDNEEVGSGKLLSTPSPVVSRTGSPSLQIWTHPTSLVPSHTQHQA